MTQTTPHALIIEARFYDDLADALFEGARKVFDARGVTYERVAVPGVLEIPSALSMALTAAEEGRFDFDLVVAIGCVIRGETDHYDHVVEQTAKGIKDVGVMTGVPCIFGVLTCDNVGQAVNRAGLKMGNAGRSAMMTGLEMADLMTKL